MMSMNETVYPRRHSRPSFIPEALRHAFGLPNKDIAESVFGYYFFRLLSRARRVVLLYDARTVGIEKVGEMSRSLAQLLYMFPICRSSIGLHMFNTSLRHPSLTQHCQNI